MSNKMKLQIGQLERQITDEKSKCDELKQRPSCTMSHMAHSVRDCEARVGKICARLPAGRYRRSTAVPKLRLLVRTLRSASRVCAWDL